MAFSFGAPAPNPGTPAPIGGGFSFGSEGFGSKPAADAPAAPAAAGGFSFGTPAESAPPATGGFSFGGSTPPATSVPAPGGFSFGGSTQIPKDEPTHAATGGSFSFGGSSTPAPVAGGFGFGGTPAAPASASASDPACSADIPEFAECFPFLKLQSIILNILPDVTAETDEGTLKGEELIHRLQCISENGVYGSFLVNPQPLKFKFADESLRQRLKQNPNIKVHGKNASLTPEMTQEIENLANQLRISELDAIALYAEASNAATRQMLEASLDSSFIDNALSDQPNIAPLVLGNNVIKAAKELYFWERSALLKTLLLLLQYRLEATPNSHLLLATDPLLNNNLITNLITMIRNSTKMIVDLQGEVIQRVPNQLPQSAHIKKETPVFAKVLIQFMVQERQKAAECLFYLAYHAQFTPEEVSSVIDLVKDLTNGVSQSDSGLPILSPITDVPDAYIKPETLPQQLYGQPFTSALPPLKEKDPLAWSKELIEKTWESGKPQLQQCVSVLITTVLCALDDHNHLWNRHTHCPNDIGNDLYRQTETSDPNDFTNILAIHERLDATRNGAGEDWKRQDIWGLLAGAYGILLVPLHSVLTSPRVSGRRACSGGVSVSSFDARRTGKACLKAVSDTNSCTFARLTLIPSFQRHFDGAESRCDLYEFLMSITAKFVSHYVDVVSASSEMPTSRTMWEKNKNETIQVQRDQQDQQRQFNLSYGATAEPEAVAIPLQVDLMQRPDCIDDIVALACVVCSAGPHFACRFWSAEEDRFVPSRLLSKLELMKNVDGTLIPVYVSFLAALAGAETLNPAMSGAEVVNEILSKGSAAETDFCWNTLLKNIRWYARRLDPRYAASTKSTQNSAQSGVSGSAGKTSTAYYYGAQNHGYRGSEAFTGSSATVTAANVADNKPMELGDANTAILLSHLLVMSRVASNFASARVSLLSMTLPIDDVDTGSLDDDSTLLVLFSLAMVGLTPEVRGAVFATIASLLRVDGANAEESKIIKEMARKAWELLELSNILPVSLLAQYQSAGETTPFQGMAFPASSLALATTGERKSVLPENQQFGILFEMEHVESRMGFYPSTEGFLQLIDALISSAGCPQDLGKPIQGGNVGGRAQLGCSPYVEYVIHFVLPRAVGSDTSTAGMLPFRTCGDQDRLIAMALEVVQRLITRYSVPSTRPGPPTSRLADDVRDAISASSQQFRLPFFAKSIVIQGEENDAQGYRLDFLKNQNIIEKSAQESSYFPRAVSPGFMIISEILSLYNGGLFASLILAITKDGADRGVKNICGFDGFKAELSQSLFRNFHLSFASARSKSLDSATSSITLRPLFTNPDIKSTKKFLMKDSVGWRELSMMRPLLILCAAAAREDAFIAATSGSTTYVPVLRFKATASPIATTSMQLSKLKALFQSYHTSSTHNFLRILTRLIGYGSSSSEQDVIAASAAFALTIYTCSEMSVDDGVRALGGAQLFASSISHQLRASLTLIGESAGHTDIVHLIFTLLSQNRISDVLLGLTNPQNAKSTLIPFFETKDCFDTVLSLIQEEVFLTNPETSAFAAKCYEIVYRQIVRDGGVSAIVIQKLEKVNFWKSNLLRFFAFRGIRCQRSLLGDVSQESARMLHSIAWFLKALAFYVSSIQDDRVNDLLASPHYFLLQAFDDMPLAKIQGNANAISQLPMSTLIDSCLNPLDGPLDVADGYQVISKSKLEKELRKERPGITEEQLAVILSSADDLNRTVQWECATSHLAHAGAILVEGSLACVYHAHSTLPLRQRTAEGQVQLLDLLLRKITTRSPNSKDSILEMTAQHISTSILFLVDRLVTVQDSTLASRNGHFLNLLIEATLSSCDRKSSASSALLGSALIRLLSVDSQFAISVDQNDHTARTISYFALLGSKPVNGVAASNLSGPQTALALSSRSIVSSLLRNSNGHDRESAWMPRMEKTALTALVQLIPILDDDAPKLLSQIASIDEGARNLISSGIMHALEAACMVYQKEETNRVQELSIGSTSSSDSVGVPSFLGPHFELLWTLLSSVAFKPTQQYEVATHALVIFSGYRVLLERARRAFPRYGNVWAALVKCLSLCGSILGQSAAGMIPLGHTCLVNDQLIELRRFIAPVAVDILQNPFPQRFLAPLPLKLRIDKGLQQGSQDPIHWTKNGTWWERIEDGTSATLPGMIMLPSPPTQFSSGGISVKRGECWSNYKYEHCLDGMRILDVSLSLLAKQHGESVLRLEYLALARGLCILAQSAKAIEARLKSFDDSTASLSLVVTDGMEIDDDNERQVRMKTEKTYLARLNPIFERCIEKLLVVIHGYFQTVRDVLGSREAKNFGETMALALESFELENMQIGQGDFVAKVTTSLKLMIKEACK